MKNDASALCHKTVETPLGPLTAAADEYGVCRVRFGPAEPSDGPAAAVLPFRAETQIAAYFAGELREFSLPLSLRGSPFALRVWQACLEAPFGEVVSYGELARRLDMPGAARAVGGALRRNPTPLLVPCHRVVGAGGGLTGFAAGPQVKRWLLEFERKETGPSDP